MIDFKHRIVPAKIKWVKGYIGFGNADWKFLFEKFCNKVILKLFLRCNFFLKEVPGDTPAYYIDSMWYNLKIKMNEEITDFIWYNTDIRIGTSCVYSDSLVKTKILIVGLIETERKKLFN